MKRLISEDESFNFETFLETSPSVSELTSSSGTCAPDAAPRRAAAAVRGAPVHRRHAAAGSMRRSAYYWSHTSAPPPGLDLWSARRAWRPASGPGWLCAWRAAAAAPLVCARRGLASSCNGGSGTRSSLGSEWGVSAQPGVPFPGRTGNAADGSAVLTRTSALWRRARASSCGSSAPLDRLRTGTHPWTGGKM